MQSNRSVPQACVVPVLVYPDVRAAVAWLMAVFSFEERVDIPDGHRSQLSFGDGDLIVADVRRDQVPPRAGEVNHRVMLRVPDVDGVVARAREHGARILVEPTDYEYGERQAHIEDLAGHHWTLSQTVADVAPEEWGGRTVVPR